MGELLATLQSLDKCVSCYTKEEVDRFMNLMQGCYKRIQRFGRELSCAPYPKEGQKTSFTIKDNGILYAGVFSAGTQIYVSGEEAKDIPFASFDISDKEECKKSDSDIIEFFI